MFWACPCCKDKGPTESDPGLKLHHDGNLPVAELGKGALNLEKPRYTKEAKAEVRKKQQKALAAAKKRKGGDVKGAARGSAPKKQRKGAGCN